MTKAIIGKKIGMTQIFDEATNKVIPLTVVEAGPCVVVQKKTVENDGYSAVQLGFGDLREKLANKPVKGHFAKADAPLKRTLKEFRLDGADAIEVGAILKADTFEVGDIVDVSGTSKGKGFQGTIKKNNSAHSRKLTVPALFTDRPVLWVPAPHLPVSSRARSLQVTWVQKRLLSRILKSSRSTQKTILSQSRVLFPVLRTESLQSATA